MREVVEVAGVFIGAVKAEASEKKNDGHDGAEPECKLGAELEVFHDWIVWLVWSGGDRRSDWDARALDRGF
ncbi:MAG: hypothetical protein BWX86_02457 [Verrucomicrobia bacterium ADurb.Bin122]|nr:MAG: hypothetical protein BWX86_02457 [Verrucomicrobia bacterium ADurb.Bin122]